MLLPSLREDGKALLMATPTIISIKPHHGGWKVFETPGIEPYFSDWDQAIQHANGRAKMSACEMRIFDAEDKLVAIIPFDDSDRKL
jgi:hypothetical protein